MDHDKDSHFHYIYPYSICNRTIIVIDFCGKLSHSIISIVSAL